MRKPFAAVLFLFLSWQPALAGNLLRMEEAERLLVENNLELQAKRADLRKSDAEVTGAGLLPNPEFRYFHEAVGSGRNDRDVTYSVIQPVDLAGKRSKRIETAEKRRNADRLFFESERWAMLTRMKQLYYRILLLQENQKDMEGILETSAEVERMTGVRVEAGDAAEGERLKVGAERKKLARALEGLKADLKVERTRLALMLNLTDSDFELETRFRYRPLPASRMESAEGGIHARADIQAQASAVDAAAASVSLAKREAAPSVGVEAGYKRWAGGLDGFVFGLAVPLPLFDRNQGRIAAAHAEREKQRLSYETVKKTAAFEIGALRDRIAHYQARVAELADQLETGRELTRIARLAYEEGEARLIELLDAVRSEKDLSMEYNHAVYEYWVSVLETERATNTRLIDSGGNL